MKVVALFAAPGIAFAAAMAAFSYGAVASEGVTAGVSSEAMEQGEQLYLKNCRMCHGSKGTSGKRLAGNKKIADAGYVAHTILIGPGYMTGFAEHLNDAEVALITTYVRNAWGHSYGPFQPEDVTPLR